MKRTIALVATAATFTISLSLVSLAPAGAAPRSAAPPASSGVAFQAKAFGTEVRVNGVVSSGASALVTIGCTSRPGEIQRNSVGSVDATPVLRSGTIATKALTMSSPTAAKSTATVQNIELLDGLISGTAVRSSSTTRVQQGHLRTSAAGTMFTSLVVAGVPVSSTVDPNTRIDLPGFGYVVLNEQTGYAGKRTARLAVDAIDVVITQQNELGIPVGASAVVARATSGLGTPAAAALDGFAYGTKARVGGGLSAGPSFKVVLPCVGTNGRVKVNTGAGVSIQGVLDTGAITDTAQGSIDADSATAETTSSVDNAGVLGDLVQATVIKADAHASSDGHSSTFSDDGSSFATLAVSGFPGIGADTPPNTHVHIHGLGTLWLHRVITNRNSIEVRMIELVVKRANSEGLPIGADIQVAVAHASVH